MILHIKRCFTAFFLLVFSAALSQEKFTLSGTIQDDSSNETLIGATIIIKETGAAVTTNEYGFYSISLPAGTYTVEITYVSFATITESITLNQNTRKNYKLAAASQQLQEVVVTSDRPRANIRKPEMSVNKLSVQEIKKMPVVMGEVDVLKSILTLPGVTNAG